jgi:dinuclear metal center YbgI/SA1388 family protein
MLRAPRVSAVNSRPFIYFNRMMCFHEPMAKASLSEVVKYCDRRLRTAEIKDFDGAANGLQVENSGRVTRIAATVDASLATVKLAIAARADLLIVHHGLFWSPTHPWTGRRRELLGLLVKHDLAVYSSHLPLDMHPVLGNNAVLCGEMGLKQLKPFLLTKGQYLGSRSMANLSRMELSAKLKKILGRAPVLLPGGPSVCRKIGVVTGGAGNLLQQAAAEGVDTYVTGEGPHWTYAAAEEAGLNVFYGGHYATETFGVKALAAELSGKFKVPWEFLDHPTGL